MASAQELLKLLITADATGAIKELKKVGDASDKELGKTTKSLDKVAAGLTKGGAAAVGFASVATVGLFKFAKAAENSELQQIKLENTLKRSPQLVGQSAKAFNDLANSIHDKTVVDDEQVVSSEALLGQFGATKQQILGLTPLIVDLSRKMGIDLDAATKSVGKALDGNAGALKRQGVALDATRFATDRYGAIQDALSKKVGGFAEKEGKTFSGQLAIMKNQLGDIAEGVGVGVIDVFEKMIGPVKGASDAFKNLSGGQQEFIGQILTVGTAAIGAIGGLSLLAGQVIKMRSRFQEIDAATGQATGNLNNFGKAAKGLGEIGLAIIVIGGLVEGLDKLTGVSAKAAAGVNKIASAKGAESLKAFNDEVKRQQELNRGKGGILPALGIDFGPFQNQTNKSRVEMELFNKVLKEGGVGAAQNLVDAMKASGESTGRFQKKIDEAVGSQKGLNDASKRGSELLNAQGSAAESAATNTNILKDASTLLGNSLKDTDSRLQLSSASFDAFAAGAKAASDAIEQSTSLDNLVAGAVKSGEAFQSLHDVVKDLPSSIDQVKLATGGYAKAQEDALSALLASGEANKSYVSGLIEQGASADEVRGKTSALRDVYVNELQGALGKNAEATQEYIDILGLTPEQVETAIKLSGDAEARTRLQLLQGQLDHLPKKVETTVTQKILQGDYQGALAAIQAYYNSHPISARVTIAAVKNPFPFGGQGRAAGGPVLSGEQYLVGEQGPELFTPGTTGNITPNNRLRSGGTWGGGSMIVVNVSSFDPKQAAKLVKDELVALKSRGYQVA